MLQKSALILLCLHSFLVHSFAQLETNEYYEYEYYDESNTVEKPNTFGQKSLFDNCFCFSDSIKTKDINPNFLGYIPIKISNDDPNKSVFSEKIKKENVLPYKYEVSTKKIKENDRKIKASEIEASEDDNPALSIVHIRRKPTTLLKISDDAQENSDKLTNNYTPGGYYYDDFKVYLVQDTIAYPNFQRVWVEMRRGDSLTIAATGEAIFMDKIITRKILCPEKITANIIEQMNDRLIALKYLSNKKRTYFVDIREAMYQFQKDNGLEWGFVDYQTLGLLGVKQEYKLIHKKKP